MRTRKSRHHSAPEAPRKNPRVRCRTPRHCCRTSEHGAAQTGNSRIGCRRDFSLDVHVEPIDHRLKTRRIHSGDQRLHFSDRIMESDLQMIHRLDHDLDPLSLSRIGQPAQTFADAAGNQGIGLVTPQSLQSPPPGLTRIVPRRPDSESAVLRWHAESPDRPTRGRGRRSRLLR